MSGSSTSSGLVQPGIAEYYGCNLQTQLVSSEGYAETSTVVSNEFLRRLVIATEGIRDHLTRKESPDHRLALVPSIIENRDNAILDHIQEDSGENSESNADNNHHPAGSTSKIHEEPCGWLSEEQIQICKEACNYYKLKCEPAQEVLRRLITHLKFLGGNEEIIVKSQRLIDKMLVPIQRLEDALTERQPEKMRELRFSISGLDDSVHGFHSDLNKEYDESFPRVWQWRESLFEGWRRTSDFLNEKKHTECLRYVINTLLSELDAAMDAACEEIAGFEGGSVTDWLSKQKHTDLERQCMAYVEKVFSATSANLSIPSYTWPEPEEVCQWQRNYTKHRNVWNKMCDEMDHLIGHYEVVGGDDEVIKSATAVRKGLRNPIHRLQKLLESSKDSTHHLNIKVEMKAMNSDLMSLWTYVSVFKKSLYHQKHAFYFREVKKWTNCLCSGFHRLHAFTHANDFDAYMNYICNDFFPALESIMGGVIESRDQSKGVEIASNGITCMPGNVAQELKNFGERSLPTFLVDEMERDSTRFVNITTIATFFSSVTATTLQFTYQPLVNESSDTLRGIVNLFWFVSLVFSVSSGVNSLLGLTWRKSSIYDSHKPPKPIRIWFDKAPMVFLIIAAISFVIGLNLFAYLSAQPHYVSFATNIFTGLHGICLMGVLAWFVYQLRHDTSWARLISKTMQWIGGLRVWRWIRRFTEWIGGKSRSAWMVLQNRIRKYKKDKHLHRNIYWAFTIDNRVAYLNYELCYEDLPEPYMFSRIIRFIVYPSKQCWIRVKKTSSSIFRSFLRYIYAFSGAGDSEKDVEIGEKKDDGDPASAKLEEAEKSGIKKAVDDYRAALQEAFGETNLVQHIMKIIGVMQDGRYEARSAEHRRSLCELTFKMWLHSEEEAERLIKQALWGYPNLNQLFLDDVRPILLFESRKKKQTKTEHGSVDKVDAECPGRCTSDDSGNAPLPGPSGLTIGSKEEIQLASQLLPGSDTVSGSQHAIQIEVDAGIVMDTGSRPTILDDCVQTGRATRSTAANDTRLESAGAEGDVKGLKGRALEADANNLSSRPSGLVCGVRTLSSGTGSHHQIVAIAGSAEVDNLNDPITRSARDSGRTETEKVVGMDLSK